MGSLLSCLVKGYFTNNMTELRVLELLYSGDEASLIVILPAKCNDIEYIEKLITAEQIHTWLSEMTEEEVEINLPRSGTDTVAFSFFSQ